MEISEYTERDRDGVIALVLQCQNDEAHLGITLEDQPDLLRIREEYGGSGGCFWVARDHGRVVGTIGLVVCGDGVAILKKFFVQEAYRGAPCHLGQQLFAKLMASAQEAGVKTIVLDTPKCTERAHGFYEKAGFVRIERSELPVCYAVPFEDSDFFRLDVR